LAIVALAEAPANGIEEVKPPVPIDADTAAPDNVFVLARFPVALAAEIVAPTIGILLEILPVATAEDTADPDKSDGDDVVCVSSNPPDDRVRAPLDGSDINSPLGPVLNDTNTSYIKGG
jgi:hypothetical protein